MGFFERILQQFQDTPEPSSENISAGDRPAVSSAEIKLTPSPESVRSPKEDVLSTREKSSSVKIGRGCTDASFVEIRDDGRGVFKAKYYLNERAAYLVDRFLGVNLNPRLQYGF